MLSHNKLYLIPVIKDNISMKVDVSTFLLKHVSGSGIFFPNLIYNRTRPRIVMLLRSFCKKMCKIIQARIAQLVAYQLGTGEVPGSNPGKGENFSMKISN